MTFSRVLFQSFAISMLLFLCKLEILMKWREKSVSATRQRKVLRWWRKFSFYFRFPSQRSVFSCDALAEFQTSEKHKRRRQMMIRWKFFFLFSSTFFLALNFSLPFTASRNEKAFGGRPRVLRRSQGDEYLIKPESSLFPPRDKSPLRVARRQAVSGHSQFIAFGDRYRVKVLYRVTRLNVSQASGFRHPSDWPRSSLTNLRWSFSRQDWI